MPGNASHRRMVTARIEFKKGCGSMFCPGKDQDIIEMCFESPEALIETMKEFEDYIYNCTARIGDEIMDLRNISGRNASA